VLTLVVWGGIRVSMGVTRKVVPSLENPSRHGRKKEHNKVLPPPSPAVSEDAIVKIHTPVTSPDGVSIEMLLKVQKEGGGSQVGSPVGRKGF